MTRAAKVTSAVALALLFMTGCAVDQQKEVALYRDALHKAVDDAKLKAQALADATGLSLGAVLTVTKGGSATPFPVGDKMSAVGGVPIEAGTQQIQASVTITYAAS